MEQGFAGILQKLIAEQGKDALTDARKCKAFLNDYTGSDYKKERRFIVQAVEAGAAQAIAGAGDLASCKKAQVRELEEEYGLSAAVAADVVNTLAQVLRGEEKEKILCKNCGKELQEEWKSCPFCGAVISQEAPSATSGNSDGGKQEANTDKPSPAVQEYLDRGTMFHERGDYETAIAEFTEAIRLDPNNSFAYFLRGYAYKEKKQYDRAINDLTTAIRLDPNNYVAYTCRGYVYTFIDQDDQAISDYTMAISLNPDDSSTYYKRGRTYYVKDQYDQAISDCTMAINLDPDYVDAYALRGIIYADKGMKNEAIRDFEKAISLDPDDESAKEVLQELRKR
jgi:tetratricopeptide (TPR) repeat protein